MKENGREWSGGLGSPHGNSGYVCAFWGLKWTGFGDPLGSGGDPVGARIANYLLALLGFVTPVVTEILLCLDLLDLVNSFKIFFLTKDPEFENTHLKTPIQDKPVTSVIPTIKTEVNIRMLPKTLNLGNKLKRKILPIIPPAPCGTKDEYDLKNISAKPLPASKTKPQPAVLTKTIIQSIL